MRTDGATQQVVRRPDVRHPIADRLVDRVLQRLAAAFHDAHFGAQQLHAKDVQRLALYVLGAHVDDALLSEHRADGRGRDAMLAGAGLGDNALLAQAARQQPLGHGVVDLVGARVRQVLALEIDAHLRGSIRRCAAQPLREILGEVECRWPANEILQESV